MHALLAGVGAVFALLAGPRQVTTEGAPRIGSEIFPEVSAVDSRFPETDAALPWRAADARTPSPPSPGSARSPASQPHGSTPSEAPGAPAREPPRAPEFLLQDLRGNTVASLYAARPVTVVHFWASFCIPCIREIPELNRLAATYEPLGAAIYAISSDDATAAELRQLERAYGIRHRVLVADRTVIGAFGGLEAFPTTFLVDRSGQIVEKHVGATKEIRERMEASLRRMLASAGRKLPEPVPE